MSYNSKKQNKYTIGCIPYSMSLPILTVGHNAGFFSCTTIFLEHLLDYYNLHHTAPERIDSTNMYTWYKMQHNSIVDIKTEYFLDQNHAVDLPVYQEGNPPIKTTNKPIEQQFVHYQYLNYRALKPFVQRFFSPSFTIQQIIKNLEEKYQLDYDNLCVLFYRGNDKAKENQLPSYEQYVSTARARLQIQPQLRFLIQSDETEFIDAMKAAFPDNHMIFNEEIRHMPRNPQTTVDRVFYAQNYVMSKYFLAITYVMAKAKYVVCGSGNCSFWIALFRGNDEGMTQFNYWSGG